MEPIDEPMERTTPPPGLPGILEESTDGEDETIFSTLANDLERMKTTANLLYHRVHTLQTLLEQDRFELSDYRLTVKPSNRQGKVREFLRLLEIQEDTVSLGVFLSRLNHWLIQSELVDLNDFQIHMTPLLSSAFYKAPGLKKIPYPLLLLSLPKMFN